MNFIFRYFWFKITFGQNIESTLTRILLEQTAEIFHTLLQSSKAVRKQY